MICAGAPVELRRRRRRARHRRGERWAARHRCRPRRRRGRRGAAARRSEFAARQRTPPPCGASGRLRRECRAHEGRVEESARSSSAAVSAWSLRRARGAAVAIAGSRELAAGCAARRTRRRGHVAEPLERRGAAALRAEKLAAPRAARPHRAADRRLRAQARRLLLRLARRRDASWSTPRRGLRSRAKAELRRVAVAPPYTRDFRRPDGRRAARPHDCARSARASKRLQGLLVGRRGTSRRVAPLEFRARRAQLQPDGRGHKKQWRDRWPSA